MGRITPDEVSERQESLRAEMRDRATIAAHRMCDYIEKKLLTTMPAADGWTIGIPDRLLSTELGCANSEVRRIVEREFTDAGWYVRWFTGWMIRLDSAPPEEV